VFWVATRHDMSGGIPSVIDICIYIYIQRTKERQRLQNDVCFGLRQEMTRHVEFHLYKKNENNQTTKQRQKVQNVLCFGLRQEMTCHAQFRL